MRRLRQKASWNMTTSAVSAWILEPKWIICSASVQDSAKSNAELTGASVG